MLAKSAPTFLLLTAACVAGGPASRIVVDRSFGTAGALGPALDLGSDGVVRLSWLEPAGEVRHRLRVVELSGSGWSAPVTVAEGEAWFANWADFPATATDAAGAMLATWLVETDDTLAYAYGVRATLVPGGPTFRLHDDDSPTEHGFVSLVALGSGAFAAAWLDGRATAHDGPMTLRARTIGADGALGEDVLLDARVCDCCQTAAVALDDGNVLVAYRDRSDDEVRDIAFVQGDPRTGKWSRPEPVANDGWEFPGCPVNGPALAARDGRVACAWFTVGRNEKPRVQVTFGSGSPVTFDSPVVVVDDAAPHGRVDAVFVSEDLLLVTWLGSEGGTSWRSAIVSRHGRVADRRILAEVPPERASGFGRLANDGNDGALFCWTTEEGIQVMRLAPR